MFKFSDIISTWSPRSIAEKDKEDEKEKEKERESPKEKHKHDPAKKRGANKENDKVKRAHHEETPKLERRTSKTDHARSQSQPKLMAAEGECHTRELLPTTRLTTLSQPELRAKPRRTRRCLRSWARSRRSEIRR